MQSTDILWNGCVIYQLVCSNHMILSSAKGVNKNVDIKFSAHDAFLE